MIKYKKKRIQFSNPEQTLEYLKRRKSHIINRLLLILIDMIFQPQRYDIHHWPFSLVNIESLYRVDKSLYQRHFKSIACLLIYHLCK